MRRHIFIKTRAAVTKTNTNVVVESKKITVERTTDLYWFIRDFFFCILFINKYYGCWYNGERKKKVGLTFDRGLKTTAFLTVIVNNSFRFRIDVTQKRILLKIITMIIYFDHTGPGRVLRNVFFFDRTADVKYYVCRLVFRYVHKFNNFTTHRAVDLFLSAEPNSRLICVRILRL